MGRLGEVALLLVLFVPLGTRAQYNAVQHNGPWGDFEDYDEREYDFDEDEDMEEDEEEYYQEEDADTSTDPEVGEPPRADPQNQEFTPMCNNENCWIRVDWEPPPRDTWMSCLLGYRVGFRKHGDDWTWMNAEVFSLDASPYIDLRSDDLFFFEEAEGTN